MDEMFKYLLSFICSGACIGFVQFLITRHDTKNDRIKHLEEELEDGLREREETGKARYEENSEAIEELRQAILAMSENNKETYEYIKGMGDAVMGLAQDKLLHLSQTYQKRGGATLEEKSVMKTIYEPYHDKLHGNGLGTAAYNYVMNELPTITQEEALRLDSKM